VKQVTKQPEDTTVKVSKTVLKKLESKAKPFETKKECLERVIMQNCGNEKKVEETKMEDEDELEKETQKVE